MAQIEKILDLADRWDDTPFDQRGTPETFCQDTPELLNDFKKFLEQRNAFGQMLQGKTAKESPESLIGNLPSDRFELIRFHDAGGLGWVYLADDRELRRPVAIKCLQPSPSADPDAIKRFLREAEITAKLDHPGIVPIYGLSRGDGHPQPFYAMRFVEGETLRDAIRTLHGKDSSIDWKGVPLARLLNAYISICETIAFAHSRGVIHRDLKSLNVMLGPFGETLVMDWGLATKWNEPSYEKESAGGDDRSDESITLAGQAIGTVGYMSPEQARGDWSQVGPPSDQFALGAILYQLLTNQSPYSGPKALENAKVGRFQRPRQILSSIPRVLEAICLKSMQAEPAMRYASVMDLKADIEQYLADAPVSAYRDSPLEKMQRVVRRHKVAVSVAGLSLVGIAGLLTFFLNQSYAQNRELQTANNKAQISASLAESSAERERERANEAEAAKQQALMETREADQLAATIVQMFSETNPNNSDTPVLLVDWIKDRLNNAQWWLEIKPNRVGPLRFHLAMALARNNFQQDAVPFLRTAISDLEKASKPKLLRQAKEELAMLLLSRTARWSPDPERDAEGIQLLTEIVASNELEPSERFGRKLALAWGHKISGNPKQAEEIANELLKECDSLDPQQPLVEAEVVLLAAGIWTPSGRAARSVESLRALLQDHENELEWPQYFLANYELANALGWMGLDHFPESLSILEGLYSKTRTKFGNVRHPNVLKVASLYVTNAIKLGGQSRQIIALLDADFGPLKVEEELGPGLTRIIASVLLAKCQIGQAEECWRDCRKVLDQSIADQPGEHHTYYLKLLLAKEMAMQGFGKEAEPLAESVYESVTAGILKDRPEARYLLGSSLQILYGVYTLLENNEEVMRVEKLFPPGVPIPTIRVRPEPKPKP